MIAHSTSFVFAARLANGAEPPKTLSTFPNGVSMVSKASVPTIINLLIF